MRIPELPSGRPMLGHSCEETILLVTLPLGVGLRLMVGRRDNRQAVTERIDAYVADPPQLDARHGSHDTGDRAAGGIIGREDQVTFCGHEKCRFIRKILPPRARTLAGHTASDVRSKRTDAILNGRKVCDAKRTSLLWSTGVAAGDGQRNEEPDSKRLVHRCLLRVRFLSNGSRLSRAA